MYQASEVEPFAPGHHGYPRASETRYRKDLVGPSWHPVSWLRRADRSSISSFHLADLGRKAVDTKLLSLRSDILTSAGSREAIPSEPPSLAYPRWRARVVERGGGHPRGE